MRKKFASVHSFSPDYYQPLRSGNTTLSRRDQEAIVVSLEKSLGTLLSPEYGPVNVMGLGDELSTISQKIQTVMEKYMLDDDIFIYFFKKQLDINRIINNRQ